jgi:hypothetical protein
MNTLLMLLRKQHSLLVLMIYLIPNNKRNERKKKDIKITSIMIKAKKMKSRLLNLGHKFHEGHRHFKSILIKMKLHKEEVHRIKMISQMKKVSRLRLTFLEVMRTSHIY